MLKDEQQHWKEKERNILVSLTSTTRHGIMICTKILFDRYDMLFLFEKNYYTSVDHQILVYFLMAKQLGQYVEIISINAVFLI